MSQAIQYGLKQWIQLIPMPSSDKKIDPKSPHNISCPVNVFDSPWSMKLSRTLKPGCLYAQLALSFDPNCLYNYSEGRGAKTENGKIACFLLRVYSRNEIDKMNSHLQKRTTNDKIWSKTVCNGAYVIGAY